MKKSKFSLAFLLLIFTLIFSLIQPLISSAQSILQSSKDIAYGNSLIRIFSENKIGFVDGEGSIAIPTKFISALNFSEGIAPARLTGKFGFINSKGKFIVQPLSLIHI